MKTLILFLFILLTMPFLVLSQTPNAVELNYDKSGNRILRQVIFIPGIIQSTGQQSDSLNTYKLATIILTDSIVRDDIVVNIYPNPTLGKFKLDLENYEESDNIQYSLHTLTGQVITKGVVNTKETQFDLQTYENGPYLFRLIINGKSNSWRIIKR